MTRTLNPTAAPVSNLMPLHVDVEGFPFARREDGTVVAIQLYVDQQGRVVARPAGQPEAESVRRSPSHVERRTAFAGIDQA